MEHYQNIGVYIVAFLMMIMFFGVAWLMWPTKKNRHKKSTEKQKSTLSITHSDKNTESSSEDEAQNLPLLDDATFIRKIIFQKIFLFSGFYGALIGFTLYKIAARFPTSFPEDESFKVFFAVILAVIFSTILSMLKTNDHIYQVVDEKSFERAPKNTLLQDEEAPEWLKSWVKKYKASGMPWIASKAQNAILMMAVSLAVPFSIVTFEVVFSTYFPVSNIAQQTSHDVFAKKIEVAFDELNDVEESLKNKLTALKSNDNFSMIAVINVANQHMNDSIFSESCLTTGIVGRNTRQSVLTAQAAEFEAILPINQVHDVNFDGNYASIKQLKKSLEKLPLRELILFQQTSLYTSVLSRNANNPSNACNVEDLAIAINQLIDDIRKDALTYNNKLVEVKKIIENGADEPDLFDAYLEIVDILAMNIAILLSVLVITDRLIAKKVTSLAANLLRESIGQKSDSCNITLVAEGVTFEIARSALLNGGRILKTLFDNSCYLLDEKEKTITFLVDKKVIHRMGLYHFEKRENTPAEANPTQLLINFDKKTEP